MTRHQHFAHIQFTEIIKNYGKRKHFKAILKDIDIELKGGQCTLISGENGSGKSTLLRIMAGLLKPESAQVNTGLETLPWKKSRATIRKHIMYLYQEPYMFDGTVKNNLSYAINKNSQTQRIQEALEWAGLEQHMNTQAKCLSGGQKQRVALAQAWLKQPSILLLDEPTANMDEQSRMRTEKLLDAFKASGMALLIASHDPHHFERIMDQKLLLKDGVITEIKHPQEFDVDNVDTNNITIFPHQRT